MKILITGFTGFVSYHFLHFLQETEPGSVVLGVDKNLPEFDLAHFNHLTISFEQLDLLNKAAVEKTLLAFQPEYILHLASVSSVAQSWQTPVDSFVNNTNIFLNLVEQIRLNYPGCRIISVGSSEEYGEVHEEQLPLTEEHALKPVSPYAVARVSQEMLSKIYADSYHLQIIMTRSFNHIGPGQKENFVISSFAKQLVTLSQTPDSIKNIVTGDLSIMRDFLDVRDVVRAYYLLLKKGKVGEVYNICSGKGTVLKHIIDQMGEILHMHIETTTNPQLIRPNENRKIIGSHEKIHHEIGWQPVISLKQSLSDMIDYWKDKLIINH